MKADVFEVTVGSACPKDTLAARRIDMPRRILILSPWGSGSMDATALNTAAPYARPDTDLVVRNLGDAAPHTPWPDAGSAAIAVRKAVEAQKDGFDGIVIGCCADPFLQQVRAAVQIPVTAPSEAAVYSSRMYGKLGVFARRLSDEFLPLIPSQGNWDFWNGTAQKYGLKDGEYYLDAVQVPKHPSPDDIDRLTSTDPDKLREVTEEAMREALETNGRAAAQNAVESEGAQVLYFACQFFGPGIAGLGEKAKEFGATILNPIPNAVTFLEHVLVSSEDPSTLSFGSAPVGRPA
jgi:Asp/Glu/hydantoin racemase